VLLSLDVFANAHASQIGGSASLFLRLRSPTVLRENALALRIVRLARLLRRIQVWLTHNFEARSVLREVGEVLGREKAEGVVSVLLLLLGDTLRVVVLVETLLLQIVDFVKTASGHKTLVRVHLFELRQAGSTLGRDS